MSGLPTSVPELRDQLRVGTAALHTALEATPIMQAFSAGCADPRTARAYLERHLVVHRALEPAIAQWLPDPVARLRLQRTGWLESDLRDHGGATVAGEAATPILRSQSEALGALYVIEGSTLGLQMVRKQRLKAGTPHWSLDSAFVRGYGDASGARWRDFLGLLATVPEHDWPNAIEAARATFAAFLDAFKDTNDE